MSNPVRSPLLAAPHGFFTRRGGVSTGIFDSLNCGLRNNDQPDAVQENRRRAMLAIGVPPHSLSSLWQVHGAEVVEIEAALPLEARPKADAMVSRTRGQTLGILTADCAPLLFHDPVAGVIGAAHSGWKGTLLRIGEATLTAMEKLGASRANIRVAIGPCIAASSYEVGPEFPAPFIATGRAAFFTPAARQGHFLFDLKGCIAADLRAAGVPHIETLPHDTCADENFFSNRRATHRSEPGFGLQLSAIHLE